MVPRQSHNHHKPSQGKECGTNVHIGRTHDCCIRTLWASDKYDFLHTVGGYTHFPRWALSLCLPFSFLSSAFLAGRSPLRVHPHPTPTPIQSPSAVQSLVPQDSSEISNYPTQAKCPPFSSVLDRVGTQPRHQSFALRKRCSGKKKEKDVWGRLD